MQRIKYLIGLIGFFIGITVVNAAGFTTSLGNAINIEPGQEFTVTMKVNGVSDFCGTMGSFTYDKTKLTLVSSSGSGGFNLTLGTNVVLDAANGANGSVSVATFKFKATSAFMIGESISISLGSQEGTSCSGDITSGTGSSVSIKMNAPKSTNNFLKSLTVSEGTINFNKNTTTYSITVDNTVDKITISAEKEDDKATISGTGSKNLNVYSNTINIVVTSESGAKKTYKVNVVRKDSEGRTAAPGAEPTPVIEKTLKSLDITGYSIEFSPDKLTYDLEIDNNVNELDISALPTSVEAVVKLNIPDSLEVGKNVITIDVTTPDGETGTYTINVTKKTADKVDIVEDAGVSIYQILTFALIPIAIGEGIVIFTLLRKNKKQYS